jgi:DNA-binding PadR family transcriptional regulator
MCKAEKELANHFLEAVIFALLERGPARGFDIVEALARELGVVVGQGRVYTLLNSLVEEGHLTKEADAKGAVYSLTEPGKEHSEKMLNRYRNLLGRMAALMGKELK